MCFTDVSMEVIMGILNKKTRPQTGREYAEQKYKEYKALKKNLFSKYNLKKAEDETEKD